MARKYNQGYYQPVNPEKYVSSNGEPPFYRSGWELRLMKKCDLSKSIVQWNSEGCVIEYFSRADNKMRRYFVDFIIKIRNKEGVIKTYLVEVKPYSQTQPPKSGKGRKKSTVLQEQYTYMVNQDKWAAASEFAKRNGMEFRIFTENELGIK